MKGKEELGFEPCNEKCPAVTGESYGSVRYCPMQQNLRHRTLSVEMKDVSPFIGDYPEGEHPFYDHEDYTDCCLNFQCCAGSIEEEGMKEIMEAIVGAAKRGEGIVRIEVEEK